MRKSFRFLLSVYVVILISMLTLMTFTTCDKEEDEFDQIIDDNFKTEWYATKIGTYASLYVKSDTTGVIQYTRSLDVDIFQTSDHRVIYQIAKYKNGYRIGFDFFDLLSNTAEYPEEGNDSEILGQIKSYAHMLELSSKEHIFLTVGELLVTDDGVPAGGWGN